MNKSQLVKWWKEEALRTWETAVYNMEGGQNLFALFMFHLTIEKLLKAAWIRDNVENLPPRLHDLSVLYNQTDLELGNGWSDYLSIITQWNIDSRYPDYKLKIYQKANQAYMNDHFGKVEDLKNLLLKNL